MGVYKNLYLIIDSLDPEGQITSLIIALLQYNNVHDNIMLHKRPSSGPFRTQGGILKGWKGWCLGEETSQQHK